MYIILINIKIMKKKKYIYINNKWKHIYINNKNNIHSNNIKKIIRNLVYFTSSELKN
jgi:hypothetical protein